MTIHFSFFKILHNADVPGVVRSIRDLIDSAHNPRYVSVVELLSTEHYKYGHIFMVKDVRIGFPFRPDIEQDMKMFYDSLNEKDQRHYAALEAKKLCYGGITYISELFNCARPTIYEGLDDIKKKTS